MRGCPLAWGRDGDAVDVPAIAVEWSVRRLSNGSAGGGPVVVYGPDGLPLRVPLDATVDDLAEAVGGRGGRYRLDFVDENGKRLTGVTVQAAYVVVGDANAPAESAESAGVAAMAPVLAIVSQMARTNSEAMTAIASNLPTLVQAVSRIVEAVDSAGVSKRPPPVVNGEAVELVTVQAEPMPPQESTWRPVVEAVLPQVPILMQAIMAFMASRQKPAAIPPTPGSGA